MFIPKLGEDLTPDHLKFLNTFSKAARQSIVQMVTNAQSGHPGGSLSCIDYLTILYAFIVGQTGEKVVVSNGHISPGVYSTLAEMGYIPKEEVVRDFRKIGSIYEGHITRHVDGVWYGTGPLGVGVSAASAFAHAEKLKGSQQTVYALAGDGECQEGQVHEMIHFSKHHKLDNLVLFIDYNKVQLTASLEETLDIDVIKTFEAGHWNVIEADAHNFEEMWKALHQANQNTGKPTVIIGHSIMGQGVDFMEETGRNHQADWHGKAPKPEQVEEHIAALHPNEEELKLLNYFRENHVQWHPAKAKYPEKLSPVPGIKTGSPIRYSADELTDCRSAYGKALLDLAKHNKNVVALTADLKGSVKTDGVSKELPEQYIECGIAEQHMVSAAGGMSLDGFVPFASTFGAFMTSRAKDQARVNDINYCNVKMVVTHCGLSVGEDGPTHQAIDDKSSFAGFFNTHIIEPTDPNQTDAIIRFIASHFGNFYVRMGRHKFPVITREDGSLFYDENYTYQYGQTDVIRQGSDLTIIATGPTVHEALKAIEELGPDAPSIELLAVSSFTQFDETIAQSVQKTGKLITVEDHNINCGLGHRIAAHLTEKGISSESLTHLGVREYQLSGKADQLYDAAGIGAQTIAEALRRL